MTATTAPTRPTRGLPILAETLGGQRGSLLLWAVALGVIVLIYTSVYPTFAEFGGIETQLEALPPAVVGAMGYDLAGTAAGYVQSSIFGLLAMVLLLVHAIGRGGRLLAGQEEEGLLELELTSAISRTRVYLERCATLLLGSALLAAVVTAVTLGVSAALDLGIPTGDLLAGGVTLYLLVAATRAIALAAGAATGRRSAALAAGAGISVLGYVGQAIAPLVDGLGWLGDATPIGWHLGAEALLEGADPARLIALAGTAVVAVAVGLAVFTRRDLVSG